MRRGEGHVPEGSCVLPWGTEDRQVVLKTQHGLRLLPEAGVEFCSELAPALGDTGCALEGAWPSIGTAFPLSPP